jgi:hypothetical protein
LFRGGQNLPFDFFSGEGGKTYFCVVNIYSKNTWFKKKTPRIWTSFHQPGRSLPLVNDFDFQVDGSCIVTRKCCLHIDYRVKKCWSWELLSCNTILFLPCLYTLRLLTCLSLNIVSPNVSLSSQFLLSRILPCMTVFIILFYLVMFPKSLIFFECTELFIRQYQLFDWFIEIVVINGTYPFNLRPSLLGYIGPPISLI